MSAIVLLDTSVYLNVLDVPGCNQDRAVVLDSFEDCIKAGDHFLLPLSAIWETGNHIARLSNGSERRLYANELVKNVEAAVTGVAPYQPTYFPDREHFLAWLVEFPDVAMRNKSPKKGEGISLVDLSIIKEWQRNCDRHPMSRVRIWSLDTDLASYDRKP